MVTVGSVVLCSLVSPMRLPEWNYWVLHPTGCWVVTYVKRTVVQERSQVLAGLLQDGMTSPHPTHTLSSQWWNFDCLQKQAIYTEDFISVAIIVLA